MTKIVTYESDFYHNGHSEQRDRLLIEMYGEQWLADMKAQGHYGGDWPEEIVGTPKTGPSGYYDENGDLRTIGEVVKLNSLSDLEKDTE
jgi:hypothetical protein